MQAFGMKSQKFISAFHQQCFSPLCVLHSLVPRPIFANYNGGQKIQPGIDCKRMHTILAQIELTNTKGIHLVTYSAYYTVIPGFGSVVSKLALAMASSSFDFDRAREGRFRVVPYRLWKVHMLPATALHI